MFDLHVESKPRRPDRFLKDSRQTLMADGYGGYDGVVVASGITCWLLGHARRKFVDAEKTARRSPKRPWN